MNNNREPHRGLPEGAADKSKQQQEETADNSAADGSQHWKGVGQWMEEGI